MKKKIQFRNAVPADALRLSILYKQVHTQTYGTEGVTTEFANFITRQFAVDKIENTILDHPGHIIVATYKDNLVGVAEVALNKKCPVGNIVGPELSKLYVLEWFTGEGIGYGLLKRAERYLIELGEKEIWLWTYVLNPRAIEFYERQEYEWIGNAFLQMEFNNYENKVMWKKLSPVE